MRCEVCNNSKATKVYKTVKICGECLKTACLFCSTNQNKLVLREACAGHTVTFDNKHNRFLADKQFLNEALFSMEEGSSND
jgi:hypothetical protein